MRGVTGRLCRGKSKSVRYTSGLKTKKRNKTKKKNEKKNNARQKRRRFYATKNQPCKVGAFAGLYAVLSSAEKETDK